MKFEFVDLFDSCVEFDNIVNKLLFDSGECVLFFKTLLFKLCLIFILCSVCLVRSCHYYAFTELKLLFFM